MSTKKTKNKEQEKTRSSRVPQGREERVGEKR